MKSIKIKLAKQIIAYSLPANVRTSIEDDLTLRNPTWIENHKMGRWNRGVPQWLRFFEKKKSRFIMPIGYLDDLLAILNRSKISFELYEQRCKVSAKIEFTGKLRPFQDTAMRDVLEYDRGTLEAPTGSGKTVMALFSIAYRKQKTLIIVHTKDLAYQWIERAQSFLNLSEWEIGLIGDGKSKIGDELTIALVQSIYSRADLISREFGYVIVDECHRTPSRTFTEAISAFRAQYLLGLSATPFRRDNLTSLIFWHLGLCRHKVDKKELIEEGHILSPIFIMRETTFQPLADPIAEYSTMISELTQDLKRNDLICEDVLAALAGGDCCLILSDRKAHCHFISDRLKEKYGVESEILTGDVKRNDRKKIICRISPTDVKVVCATGQLIGEGFDCENLNALFIASPIKFSGRVLQYIGRIMRPGKDKERPIVYDYADWQIDVLERAARSRIKLYGEQNTRHL